MAKNLMIMSDIHMVEYWEENIISLCLQLKNIWEIYSSLTNYVRFSYPFLSSLKIYVIDTFY